MTFLSVVEFTEPVLGIAFSFGFALLLAFVCLRLLMGLMTRQQYNVDHNVINDPGHSRSILWLGAAVAGADAESERSPGAGTDALPNSDGGGSATGVPYLLPAAAPVNRFARNSKLNLTSSSRVVELPRLAPERVEQVGLRDGWGGHDGDAA